MLIGRLIKTRSLDYFKQLQSRFSIAYVLFQPIDLNTTLVILISNIKGGYYE